MYRPAILFVLSAFASACSLTPPESEHLRAQRMEEAVLPMAATAVDAGQVETARRLYRRLLDVDPESVPARMGLGDVALRSGDSSAAARWYLAALNRSEEPSQRHAALLAHGRAALAAGQLEAARSSFTELTTPEANAPRTSVAWGHNGVGLSLLLEGNLRGATDALEKAVLIGPEEQRFQANLDRALAMVSERSAPAVVESQSLVDSAVEHVEAFVRADEESPVEGEAPESEPVEQVSEAVIEPNDADKEAGEEPADPVPETGNPTKSPARPDVAPAAPPRALVVTENGAMFLQFGAYAEPDNAETVATHLRLLTDWPVSVTDTLEVSESPLQRVRIGPLGSRDALLELISALETHGYNVVNYSQVPGGDVDQPPPRNPLAALLIKDAGELHLQAGAYGELANAEARAEQLRRITELPVRVTPFVQADGPPLHRVRIGPLKPDDPLIELFDLTHQ